MMIANGDGLVCGAVYSYGLLRRNVDPRAQGPRHMSTQYCLVGYSCGALLRRRIRPLTQLAALQASDTSAAGEKHAACLLEADGERGPDV